MPAPSKIANVASEGSADGSFLDSLLGVDDAKSSKNLKTPASHVSPSLSLFRSELQVLRCDVRSDMAFLTDGIRVQLTNLAQHQDAMTKMLSKISATQSEGRPVNLPVMRTQERAATPLTPAPPTSEGACMDPKVLEEENSHGKYSQLKRIFSIAEEVEQEEAANVALNQQSMLTRLSHAIHTMTWNQVELQVDLFVGFLICLNALLIGLQMDNPDPPGMWLAIDVTFSISFIMELTFKVYLHGFKGQFCGDGWLANCFDAFLIALDLAQLTLAIFFPGISKELSNAPSASLFRIIRLARLARLVRAMKAEIFRSLAEMIHGIAAGMGTLAWSFVLFFFCLYVSALVLREGLGRTNNSEPVEHVTEMFDSVPRSIYTMYRCSFVDCSSHDGTPIFEQVFPTHGSLYVFFYTAMTFITTVVIFNVISAMFVESTMTAAAALQQEKRIARMKDERLLSSTITFLIKKILYYSPEHEVPESMMESLDKIINDEVPLSVVDVTIQDPEVKQALDRLDIDPQDHERLADIFDPDNGGTVELLDVATGLNSLRSDPRRSDIVCVDLMIRSVQQVLREILAGVEKLQGEKS